MQFHPFKARDNWRKQWKELGYSLEMREEWKQLGYKVDLLEGYWVEDTEHPFCARFEKSEIADTLIPATIELNEMVLALVDYVCTSARSDELFEQLRVPVFFREAVRRSWQRRDSSIYGRFDFAYDGQSLKLLEINFDAPIMILESSVLQGSWYKDYAESGGAGMASTQCNHVCDNLNQAFAKHCLPDQTVHFSSFYGPEDEQAAFFLKSLAEALGLNTTFVRADQFGLAHDGTLLDPDGLAVRQLFKMYPWEMLIGEDLALQEKFGKFFLTELVESGRVVFWEPAWKYIASNKAAMALLWEMSPRHPWLLETRIDDGSAECMAMQAKAHVRKPIFGRGGANVSIVFPGQEEHSEQSRENNDEYGQEGYILQDYQPLVCYEGHYAMLGSWVIDGKPSGIGIRADRSRITGANTLFVPHYVAG